MSNLSRKLRRNKQFTVKSGKIAFNSANNSKGLCPRGSNLQFDDCHSTDIPSGVSEKPHTFVIGGARFYRPHPSTEIKIRRLAETALRETIEPGTYRDFDNVKRALESQVAIFGERFDELIPRLASRDLLEFILWQFGETGKIEDLAREKRLHGSDLETYFEIIPTHRRALKYIAERITMLAPGEMNELFPPFSLLDEAFLCAERLIEYCILCNDLLLFPKSTTVVVQIPGRRTYLDQSVDTNLQDYRRKMFADNLSHSTLFPNSFETDLERQGNYLNAVMTDELGFSWSEAISILTLVCNNSRPPKGENLGTKFILKAKILEYLAKQYHRSPAVMERLLSGFALQKEKLLARAKGDDDYWNPQFEHRAYRRAIFVMPHALGEHYAFCDRMFMESLRVLIGSVCFGDFPEEWRTKKTMQAVNKLVTARGNWFESEIQKLLKVKNINGVSSRTKIGRDRTSISLPGEFDFLGWLESEQTFILLEAKMLKPGAESKLWKNQIDDFLVSEGKKESYVSKLDRKAKWLASNLELVTDCLKAEGLVIKEVPNKVAAGFVTYLANPAEYFVTNFPCKSLAELIIDIKQANYNWPYSTGVYFSSKSNES